MPPGSRRSTSCWRRSSGSSGGIPRRRSWAPTSAARPRTSGSCRGCSRPTRTCPSTSRARLAELGRQPYTARAFFVRHADRILFGTDEPADPAVYRLHYRFLETWDESFDYSTDAVPGQGRWQIHGLGLPDDVLRAVYRDNAVRVLRLDRATRADPPA